jgi:hypothetical protein
VSDERAGEQKDRVGDGRGEIRSQQKRIYSIPLSSFFLE